VLDPVLTVDISRYR